MAPSPPPKFTKKNGVNMLNPDYLAWKRQHGNQTSTGIQSKPWEPPIDRMTVQIHVIQGQDLVAKDRNLFGKRTSSDPYVLVSFASSPPSSTSGQVRREQKTKLGQTVTVKKNLSPTWNFSVTASIPYNKKSHSNSLVFQIFDQDKLSADDSMGVVSLPLEFKDSAGPAAWYNIPKNSGKNASGKIQIQIQTSLHRVQGLTPYC